MKKGVEQLRGTCAGMNERSYVKISQELTRVLQINLADRNGLDVSMGRVGATSDDEGTAFDGVSLLWKYQN